MEMPTAFTKAFNLKYPIASAAMTGTAGGKLAAATSKGGGLGFLACFNLDILKTEIQIAREDLGLTKGEALSTVGVGFLGWLLDTRPQLRLDEGIDYALDQGVAAIWLSFGRDLGKWVRRIRKHRNGRSTKLFILVSAVNEATNALSYGPDVLICQGTEAGGHGSSQGIPLISLLPMLLDALPPERPLILAAGGISCGSQIAAALSLGADGVVMGTRFLPTPESMYGEHQKQAILKASGNATARTFIFDIMTDSLDWPDNIDGRALVNTTLLESLEGKRSNEELRKDYETALEGKDTTRIAVWAGASVGVVNSAESATHVVQKEGEAALKCLQAVSARFSKV